MKSTTRLCFEWKFKSNLSTYQMMFENIIENKYEK